MSQADHQSLSHQTRHQNQSYVLQVNAQHQIECQARAWLAEPGQGQMAHSLLMPPVQRRWQPWQQQHWEHLVKQLLLCPEAVVRSLMQPWKSLSHLVHDAVPRQ